jgi:hypothetical protein
MNLHYRKNHRILQFTESSNPITAQSHTPWQSDPHQAFSDCHWATLGASPRKPSNQNPPCQQTYCHLQHTYIVWHQEGKTVCINKSSGYSYKASIMTSPGMCSVSRYGWTHQGMLIRASQNSTLLCSSLFGLVQSNQHFSHLIPI